MALIIAVVAIYLGMSYRINKAHGALVLSEDGIIEIKEGTKEF